MSSNENEQKAQTEEEEHRVDRLQSLKPFAKFLLAYRDQGGTFDAELCAPEMREILSVLKETFKRTLLDEDRAADDSGSYEEQVVQLLEKAASGAYEDDLLMQRATDGEGGFCNEYVGGDQQVNESKCEDGRFLNDCNDDDDNIKSRYNSVVSNIVEGFVVKTRAYTGEKVLVNVCGCSEVPKPKKWRGVSTTQTTGEGRENFLAGANEDENDVLEELNDMKNTHRFPHSCSDVREDYDKEGAKCDVYDVAFNDEVCALAKKAMFLKFGDKSVNEAILRDCLATIAIEAVSKKRGSVQALNPKFSLPKRAFAGLHPPPPMRIKKLWNTNARSSSNNRRQRIVEVNREEQEEQEEEEEESGFAFRLNKQQRQQKKRVQIETTYPDKPLTTFALVTLTFDCEKNKDRAKLNFSGRSSIFSVSFDNDIEEDDKEEHVVFPFFIDVENVHKIKEEDKDQRSIENGNGSGSRSRRGLSVTYKVPFKFVKT